MATTPPSASFFAQVSTDLMQIGEETPTLQTVVERAVEVVPACDAASVTLRRRRNRTETVAASSDLARRADQLQYDLEEGPCLEAAVTGEPRLSNRLDNSEDWPRWGPRAAEVGVNAILGIQLSTNDEVLGALNLYAGKAGCVHPRGHRHRRGLRHPRHQRPHRGPDVERPAHGAAHPPHDRGRPGHPDAALRAEHGPVLRAPAPLLEPQQHQAGRGGGVRRTAPRPARHRAAGTETCSLVTAVCMRPDLGYREHPHSPEVPRMQLPLERGPISRHVIESLGRPHDETASFTVGPADVIDDPDAQLALWILYELHYRGFDGVAGRPRVGPRAARAASRARAPLRARARATPWQRAADALDRGRRRGRAAPRAGRGGRRPLPRARSSSAMRRASRCWTSCASAACSSSRSPTRSRSCSPGSTGRQGRAGRAPVRRVRRRPARAPARHPVRRRPRGGRPRPHATAPTSTTSRRCRWRRPT